MSDGPEPQSPEPGAEGERHEFQAEVARLLHLMVHAVYSEREVFLRELVSNAADACDKLRYDAIAAPALLEKGGSDFAIRLVADAEARTLTVLDNGIGMNREELVANLGTIARSGTREFLEAAGQEGGANLIGQFGVGFYSAFIVADRVEVLSRRAGAEEGFLWRSDGTGAFEILPAGEDAPERGTRITLHLKEDADEFLEEPRLRHIVRRYSDHIPVPILWGEGADGETLNAARALWTRPKSDITEEQYKEFYHHVAHAMDEPALTVHWVAEGRVSFTALLFAPREKPFDLFDPGRKGRVRLYVRRVFITDDADLLPPYLRFVRGVVDSDDMPLNLSREMLQNNPMVAGIRRALTGRVLSELQKLAEKEAERFTDFWGVFGPVLKEGLYEDPERAEAILKLCRFTTTAGEGRTLGDYLADRKEGQDAIYFIAGENAAALRASPQIEGFRARGIEVLLLGDPVDAFWTVNAAAFEEVPFRSVTLGADDLERFETETSEDASEKEDAAGPGEAAFGTLIAAMKQALEGQVSDVRRSARLTDSACCLVAAEGGLDMHVERLLKRQGVGPEGGARVFEINAKHPLIKALADRVASGGVDARVEDAVRLLHAQCLVAEGDPLPDPQDFAKRLARVIEGAVGKGG